MMGSLYGEVINVNIPLRKIDLLTPGGIGFFIGFSNPSTEMVGKSITVFTSSSYDSNGVLTATWGYLNVVERDIHDILTTVGGVSGTKAFAILSKIPFPELVIAINSNDKTTISKADGVGPKLSETICSTISPRNKALMMGMVSPTLERHPSLIMHSQIMKEIQDFMKTLTGKMLSASEISSIIMDSLKEDEDKQNISEMLRNWKNNGIIQLIITATQK